MTKLNVLIESAEYMKRLENLCIFLIKENKQLKLKLQENNINLTVIF